MSWKEQTYYQGESTPPPPPMRDPRKPLPGEVSPARKRLLRLCIAAVVIFAAGAMLGIYLAPESPEQVQEQLLSLHEQLQQSAARVAELERTLHYQSKKGLPALANALSGKDRQRHEEVGRRYARQLQKVKAQGAAELVLWFVQRWNSVLTNPQPDDRVGRRAEILALLAGSMAETLHPGDYVAWQEEFFTGNWLGELHFDMDGDGLPAKRSAPNPGDGFANVSVCQIAMALNQALTDAHVFITSDMRCDRPEMKVSIVLGGKTLNDALNRLVTGLKKEGFAIVETKNRAQRFVLIGPGRRMVVPNDY